eukprot:GSChrysophyteH1.ASY1.ANO1.216.1 assembled CDS
MSDLEGLLSEKELEQFFSQDTVTIIGFGSLISETSSRGTFPTLSNFREARIEGHRRLYQHPAFIFFERGIANLEENTYSSLSTEPCEGCGFVATVFEISGMGKDDWLRREEEFLFSVVTYTNLKDGKTGKGIMCTAASSDEVYIDRWGREKYEANLAKASLKSIWAPRHEHILPCWVYLRHCVLAARGRSETCFNSFLDECYLADRKTTIRAYLDANPGVMETEPPANLLGRYSG